MGVQQVAMMQLLLPLPKVVVIATPKISTQIRTIVKIVVCGRLITTGTRRCPTRAHSIANVMHSLHTQSLTKEQISLRGPHTKVEPIKRISQQQQQLAKRSLQAAM